MKEYLADTSVVTIGLGITWDRRGKTEENHLWKLFILPEINCYEFSVLSIVMF